ncbi:MAG: response regulator transcription factor [Actinomycetota bacterium]|nr:response regulator transcription factor [Actinomycetota bacterium]
MTAELPVRILIVDDHPVVRSGLRALLQSTPGYQVVGEAGDGRQAVSIAADTHPDVIVMDLYLPEMDGVAATKEIMRHPPAPAILMLTMADDDASLVDALQAGARGYILKGSQPSELLRAIQTVVEGEAVFTGQMAARLSSLLGAKPPGTPRALAHLTEREREILDLIARGDGNPVIARRLGIRPKTVRNHVSNIFTKLGVDDRTGAIHLARDQGLGNS